MFDIRKGTDGQIQLFGRFDAAQVEVARSTLQSVDRSCVIDFSGLDYISSAGMGILLGTQKRLAGTGHSLKLVNMNRHIREVFRIAGFDTVFPIE